MPTLTQVTQSIERREVAVLTAAGAHDIGQTIVGSVSVEIPRAGDVIVTRMTQHRLTREQWLEVCNADLN